MTERIHSGALLSTPFVNLGLVPEAASSWFLPRVVGINQTVMAALTLRDEALALGLGTMIGWKRIVVTVGEKIGKARFAAYGWHVIANIDGRWRARAPPSRTWPGPAASRRPRCRTRCRAAPRAGTAGRVG